MRRGNPMETLNVALLSLILAAATISDVAAKSTGTTTEKANTSDNTDANVSEPHLVVENDDGDPCLLATLNATMEVSYQVQEGIVHEAPKHSTYMAVADIQLPEDVQSKGTCGENSSSLLLTWGNNETFVVNMTFTRKGGEDNSTRWSLTSLAVTYDLSDKTVFPGASENQVVTVERHDLTLFNSPSGYSFVCDQDRTTHVGTVDRGVDVTFHQVHLAAFGVTSSDFPSETEHCTDEDDSNSDDDILIPLIVACCLSALVVIIVIGYVISRKVQEAREQSEYKPMP